MFYNMRTTTAIPTGAKMPYDFEEIIKIIKQSIGKGSKIFIGSDSFMTRKQV